MARELPSTMPDLRSLTDDQVIDELRHRGRRARIARNLPQAELARQAGLSYHTVNRFEADQGAPSLATFVAILRVLGAVDDLDAVLPVPPLDPLDPMSLERQRASKRTPPAAAGDWRWGDEE